MHGNVWEWCEDSWHDNYQESPTDGSAWTDNQAQTSRRVLRGGSWNGNPDYCRSADRYNYDRGLRSFLNGLRLVCVSGID
ncbi:MAG: hypothetical protein RLZZ568_1266 [Cyanobacteriota bacterium]